MLIRRTSPDVSLLALKSSLSPPPPTNHQFAASLSTTPTPMASCSDEPSTKRKRPANEAEPSSTPIKGEPYFDDGNVILAVGQTYYRNYWGVLKKLSPVFDDMFAVPQPPTGERLVDGCPVVVLSDSAEDWEILLKSYFLRRYFFNTFSDAGYF